MALLTDIATKALGILYNRGTLVERSTGNTELKEQVENEIGIEFSELLRRVHSVDLGFQLEHMQAQTLSRLVSGESKLRSAGLSDEDIRGLGYGDHEDLVRGVASVTHSIRSQLVAEPAIHADDLLHHQAWSRIRNSVFEGIEAHRLLAWLSSDGEPRIFSFQFDPYSFEPHKTVMEVNEILGSVMDPIAKFSWWLTPNSNLWGRSPRDESLELLENSDSSERLKEAASNMLDGGHVVKESPKPSSGSAPGYPVDPDC